MIVPFAGDRADASATRDGLRDLNLREGDEVIVADNSVDQVFSVEPDSGMHVVAVATQRSSYYARNVACEAAKGDWLLFIDADCIPSPGLIDAYLDPPPAQSVGLMGGPILTTGGDPRSLLARWGRSRERQRELFHLRAHPLPAAPTANLIVRREAWRQVGGFQEGIRSAGDIELCWRIQKAGWGFERREDASVEHRPVESMRPFLRRTARHGAGRTWINRRSAGWWSPPSLPRELVRGFGGALVYLLTLRPEKASFKLIDTAAVTWNWVGSLQGNGAERPTVPIGIEGEDTRVLVITDNFPALSETFVANEVRALVRLGERARVEGNGRPERPDRTASRDLCPGYLEDDGVLQKLASLAWLLARHPLRCARDLGQRRRWERQEEVWPLRSLAPQARRIKRHGDRLIHVHFAGPAALNALRLGRLLGIPWTLTAHAYDIFQQPRNLAEKVREATFVTGHPPGLAELERLAGSNDTVRKLIYGIDPSRLRRESEYPGGGEVLAVGRLVEKKGFGVLIEAAALLRSRGAPLTRIRIVGDGPLREELERAIAAQGLEEVVELLGWREPDEVKELLEQADLVAMPSVIATDGDRDSMPLVVKEAMAMEVPVVASDEVGLPEFVRDEWGRLVPPGDPDALASAIGEVLSLSREERIRMGAAGRAFAVRELDAGNETRRLADWIDAELSGDATGARRTTQG